MRSALKVVAGVMGAIVLAAGAVAVVGVRASDHPTEPAKIGEARSFSQLGALIDVAGPIEVETITGAEWAVPRGGLVNLDHPEAKAAALKDELESIEIYLHVLRHPKAGRFLVDTGVEKALRDDPSRAAIRGLVASAMHFERLVVRRDTASVVSGEGGALAGVLLTHLHFDHISGMPDIPRGTAVYAGPGETSQRYGLNLFAKGTNDRLLEGHRPIAEWQFSKDPDGRFEGILDVFGDGSLFALWVPGHTAGSTAYLARTPQGPVLFTGDTSHSEWGWKHAVEPGDFTRDRPQNAVSLKKLVDLVKEHPSISVRLGHQPLRP